VQKANIIATMRRDTATQLELIKVRHLSEAAQKILK